jgi:hypothetical protein
VAGNPTVTTAQPRFNISRFTALEKEILLHRWPSGKSLSLRYFGGHEDHHWHNRRVVITINNKTHIHELSTEITHIASQLMNSLLT